MVLASKWRRAEGRVAVYGNSAGLEELCGGCQAGGEQLEGQILCGSGV